MKKDHLTKSIKNYNDALSELNKSLSEMNNLIFKLIVTRKESKEKNKNER